MASFILLTGQPGCGKTTLLRKVVEELRSRPGKLEVKGFYTEDVTDQRNQRIGFDFVTLDGSRGVLARVGTAATGAHHRRVGKYSVQLQEFENLCLHKVDTHDEASLLVIDEIGTMELLSERFREIIDNILASDKKLKLFATVPLRNANPLIQQLKDHPRAQVFHVTKSNRDHLVENVLKATQNLVC